MRTQHSHGRWSLMAALLLSASSVHGQSIAERSPLDLDAPPSELDSPDVQPGFRAGPVWVRPGASLSMAYDSNVFAAPAARQDDELSITGAQVEVANDPGDLSLAGQAFVRARRFLDLHDQDYGIRRRGHLQRDARRER